MASPVPPVALAADPLLRTLAPSRPEERAGWPVLERVDRRGADPRSGMFSDEFVRMARSVLDNGEGFSEALIGVAFQQQFSSTRDVQRGRGLLEVSEAVDRLGGSVKLFQYQAGDFRIKILFPSVTST